MKTNDRYSEPGISALGTSYSSPQGLLTETRIDVGLYEECLLEQKEGDDNTGRMISDERKEI